VSKDIANASEKCVPIGPLLHRVHSGTTHSVIITLYVSGIAERDRVDDALASVHVHRHRALAREPPIAIRSLQGPGRFDEQVPIVHRDPSETSIACIKYDLPLVEIDSDRSGTAAGADFAGNIVRDPPRVQSHWNPVDLAYIFVLVHSSQLDNRGQTRRNFIEIVQLVKQALSAKVDGRETTQGLPHKKLSLGSR
jgi:hypothetical protein